MNNETLGIMDIMIIVLLFMNICFFFLHSYENYNYKEELKKEIENIKHPQSIIPKYGLPDEGISCYKDNHLPEYFITWNEMEFEK